MKRRFQNFVARRYLMARPIHVSWLALLCIPIALAAAGGLLGAAQLIYGETLLTPAKISHEHGFGYSALTYSAIGLAIVAAVMPYVFLVRLFFTFYTTVSVVGVSIGGAALVTVLSVMNGFEGHLRHKILGSNAHIQVSKEDGEFTEWEEIRDRVAKVPGVVASTPFATSEVVIASNGNYHNVVIKGIDVPTAVKVTDLARFLVDKDGLDNLPPLVQDEEPEQEPAPPRDPSKPVVDPAPPDLEEGGEPIDYSGGAADAGPARSDGAHPELPPDYGGDARVLLGGPPVDPAPDDFAGGDEVDDGAPRDFSGDTPPPRPLTGTSRISTLPGILVGRELEKTIHVYTNQEVRLVSPLADPMNPDANGTPIPFNRDYRVAGVFYTGMYEYDLKLVYVTLESLQQFLRMGDAVEGIEIRITDPDDVDTVVARISKALGPAYHVQGWKELNRQLFSALKLEKIAMFIILAIIILVASFSIVGTLIMIVVEKGRQIALFKTLGASDREVVLLFVIQGSLIGLIGSVLGVAIGLGLCGYLHFYGFPIPADVYYMSTLPVEVDPMTVAVIFAAGVLISVAATIYPSVLAAQLRPAVGLKKL
ncbi:MAG TPA: ABC transporter permease [Kofleriaceae bacterium]|nr:ABC transporter permease [Kofleriaceae bacterium]